MLKNGSKNTFETGSEVKTMTKNPNIQVKMIESNKEISELGKGNNVLGENINTSSNES